MIVRMGVGIALGLAAISSVAQAIQYEVNFQGDIVFWGIPPVNIGPYDIPGPLSPFPASTFTGSFVYDPATPQSHFQTIDDQAGYQHTLPGGFQLDFPAANGGTGVAIAADDYVVEVFNDAPSTTIDPSDFFTVEFNTDLIPTPTSDLSINGTPYNGFYGDPPTGTRTGRVKIQLLANDSTLFDTNTSLPAALLPAQFGISLIGGDITELPAGSRDVLLGSVSVTSIEETFLVAPAPPPPPPPAPPTSTPEPASWQLWLLLTFGLSLCFWRRQRSLQRAAASDSK